MSLEQTAFDEMARLYPREIHDLKPEKFWELFHRIEPGVSREEMEARINQTPYYADAVEMMRFER